MKWKLKKEVEIEIHIFLFFDFLFLFSLFCLFGCDFLGSCWELWGDFSMEIERNIKFLRIGVQRAKKILSAQFEDIGKNIWMTLQKRCKVQLIWGISPRYINPSINFRANQRIHVFFFFFFLRGNLKRKYVYLPQTF